MANNQIQQYNWNQSTMYPQTNPNIQMMQQQPYPVNSQNAYAQPMQPQTMIKPQINYIPGRPTQSPDEVQAFEVPMDCPMSIFPRTDRREIYVKYWGEKGTIETDTYVLVDKSQPAQNEQQSLEELQKQLNRIERMLKYNGRSKYNGGKQKQKGGNPE